MPIALGLGFVGLILAYMSWHNVTFQELLFDDPTNASQRGKSATGAGAGSGTAATGNTTGGGTTGLAGLGIPGKVVIGPHANLAGQPINNWVVRAVGGISGVVGHALTIGTGTNHSTTTKGGNHSDHPDGNAADIPASGPDLTRLGQAAERYFGLPVNGGGLFTIPAWTDPQTGKRYRVQVIFNIDTPQAGNHFTHLHVGMKPV